MSGNKSNRDQETPDENGHLKLKEPAVLAAFKTCAPVTRACKMDGISRDGPPTQVPRYYPAGAHRPGRRASDRPED
jgi:hypothetical protein